MLGCTVHHIQYREWKEKNWPNKPSIAAIVRWREAAGTAETTILTQEEVPPTTPNIEPSYLDSVM